MSEKRMQKIESNRNQQANNAKHIIDKLHIINETSEDTSRRNSSSYEGDEDSFNMDKNIKPRLLIPQQSYYYQKEVEESFYQSTSSKLDLKAQSDSRAYNTPTSINEDDMDYQTARGVRGPIGSQSLSRPNYGDFGGTQGFEKTRKKLDTMVSSQSFMTLGRGKDSLGSDSGSQEKEPDEEEGTDSEHQARFFINEEKVIRNHLKLNFTLQALQILTILLAMTFFDWVHVIINTSKSTQLVYHVSLLNVEVGDPQGGLSELPFNEDKQPKIWLYNLMHECYSDKTTIPSQFCDRSWSLFLAGSLTFIGLTVASMANVYNTFQVANFQKRHYMAPFQLFLQKNLCHLYIAIALFYFVLSLSFVYLRQLGTGQYFLLLGALMAVGTSRHFKRQYKRLKHIQLVKTLVVTENSIKGESQGNNEGEYR
ncbi:hypothetical protein FGO68_gene17790 [Halteria grandinella]|uniref:Transmembrane protein n=1 Tax=Halteria grandinella TaxID=5974 RepID=A0A8J8T279_HALGN|nr:hypothetical protein FGO68_gene17790 [Halteria grandinella]